jgi:hypothetical protein
LHVQVGPQLQALPHWQPVFVSAFLSWQPQLQPAPGQVSHSQRFELVFMTRSFGLALTQCQR